MRLSCNDFKIWKLVEGNYKLYIFTFFFFIIIVVNTWISLFIRLYNLCFLRNTLIKIPRAATTYQYLVFVFSSETESLTSALANKEVKAPLVYMLHSKFNTELWLVFDFNLIINITFLSFPITYCKISFLIYKKIKFLFWGHEK